MLTRFYLLMLSLLSMQLASAELREWTDDQNRKVTASYLETKGDKAILKLKNGRKVPFPLTKLSAADQEFIKAEDASRKKDSSKEKLNFDAEWPKLVRFKDDPEIKIIKEDKEKKSFIYESANYRYDCDVRLSRSVVKGFAVLFEATYQYCYELPLALGNERRVKGKYPILLFETKEAYVKAGGPPSSGGCYMPGKNLILVPLTSLGVRKVGSGYMLNRDRSSKTLPHEIVHQLSPNRYYARGSRGWFSEGIAEYVAVTPYRSGGYNNRVASKAFIEYVTAYGRKGKGGKALGKEIKIGPLKDYMMQSYSSFTANGRKNYGVALLITNYFCHMDRKKDAARLKKFLKALRAGKTGEGALEILLDGDSWEELEKSIIKAYRGKGITLEFS